MKPMLAEAVEFYRLEGRYPFYMQPKLDGIRCLIVDGVARSRSLKPLPNLFIQQWAAEHAEALEGFDGELMVGAWTDRDVFKRTHSAVMTITGEPNFSFAWFDNWKRQINYTDWLGTRGESDAFDVPRVQIVGTTLVENREEIVDLDGVWTNMGYEGSIIRSLDSPYKFGRSTAKQTWLLKLKEWIDEEATIVELIERQHNSNPAFINEVGRTTHSSHKEGMIGAGTLGTMVVKNEKWDNTFRLGLRLDDTEKLEIWNNRKDYIGRQIKFKYKPTEGFERPRNPVFLGFRDSIDTGGE